MSTLTISLPDDVLQRLSEKAKSEHRTPESVVAEQVSRLVSKSDTDALMKLAGFVTSKIPDAAEKHDEYLGKALADELLEDDAK